MHNIAKIIQNTHMNQIIFSKHSNTNINTENNQINNIIITPKISKRVFIFLLFFSILVSIIVLISMAYSAYKERQQENSFSNLSTNYSISRLYANNSASPNTIIFEKPNFTIIGIIKIDKIKLSSPILSEINDDLLKIAPCKFSGPNANEVGNLCIAAHNYNDSRFFSNISKLNIDDEIQIFNSNGKMLIYKVFEKYETEVNDVSCTLPQGNNTIEITLITCNNFNGNRIIVKAKSMT